MKTVEQIKAETKAARAAMKAQVAAWDAGRIAAEKAGYRIETGFFVR